MTRRPTCISTLKVVKFVAEMKDSEERKCREARYLRAVTRPEPENALGRKWPNCRKLREWAAAEQQPPSPIAQLPSSSASIQSRRVSLGNSSASVGTRMATATDVFWTSSPPPLQVSTSSPTTAVPVPVVVPGMPAGASLRCGDPATLSPAMFFASGSPHFSPETDG